MPKTHLKTFCTLLTLLLLLDGCDSTPKIRPLAAGATLLAFGDSLTHGGNDLLRRQ